VLLALGVLTLGFAWLLGAVLCWVAVAPVHWLPWAVAFSILGLVLVPVFLNAAINANKPRSSPGSSPTVPLGSPVSVRSDLGVDLHVVPASVTTTGVHPAPAAGGTATVDLKVCATTQSVDPSFAADGLELGTAGSAYLVADTNLLQASSSFGTVLPPGHCTTGPGPLFGAGQHRNHRRAAARHRRRRHLEAQLRIRGKDDDSLRPPGCQCQRHRRG
jgi:hypothetical protein